MRVYGYHAGCRYEGCHLVSLHETRAGAIKAALATMRDDDAEYEEHQAKNPDRECQAKWFPTNGRKDHWNQRWKQDGKYESEGSQVVFVKAHSVRK